MHLAAIDPFPHRPVTAEREFIGRLQRACDSLGWRCTVVATSDDILAAAPDAVLATHEYCPKLTPVPTLGLLWSPPAFFERSEERRIAIGSHDGYLTGGDSVDRWLAGFAAETRIAKPIGPRFWPSTYATPFERFQGERRALFYAGARWDGRRHGGLFGRLDGNVPLSVWGPAASWSELRHGYRGQIPLDGSSLLQKAAEAGAALCVHKSWHRAANLPSMRLFEAAAASCTILADDLPFTRQYFGDSVLYVDSADDARAAEQIAAHMQWLAAHPATAQEMAEASHRIFVDRLCLERLLEPLPGFVGQVRRAAGFERLPTTAATPQVEVVMRVGSRPVETVKRAIASVAAQSYPNIALRLVAFAEVEGLAAMLEGYRSRFAAIETVRPPEGAKTRSTVLWTGLRTATAPYVANLDDDDDWHPNHLTSLVQRLEGERAAGFAFGGTIAVQEDAPPFFWQTNFASGRAAEPATSRERRRVALLRRTDPQALWGLDNTIGSCSWVVRRSLLTAAVLEDPQLDYLEDMCLYTRLSTLTPMSFTGYATSTWNLRRHLHANSSWNRSARKASRRQLRRRLRGWRPAGLLSRPWFLRSLGAILREAWRQARGQRTPSLTWRSLFGNLRDQFRRDGPAGVRRFLNEGRPS